MKRTKYLRQGYKAFVSDEPDLGHPQQYLLLIAKQAVNIDIDKHSAVRREMLYPTTVPSYTQTENGKNNHLYWRLLNACPALVPVYIALIFDVQPQRHQYMWSLEMLRVVRALHASSVATASAAKS